MMCFSDFVPDPETRSDCGYAFIAFIAFYATLHILFIVINTIVQVRQGIRRKYYARRNKKRAAVRV